MHPGATPLLSPPHTPPYNPLAEAGIGSPKTRTFYQAAAHGAQDRTSDDADPARHPCNQTPQPFGNGLPAPPADRRRQRPTITPAQRDAFRQGARDARAQYLSEPGLGDESLE